MHELDTTNNEINDLNYNIKMAQPFILAIQTAFSIDFNSCSQVLNSLVANINEDPIRACIISIILESALLVDPKQIPLMTILNSLLPLWTSDINPQAYQFYYHLSKAIFINKTELQEGVLSFVTDKLFSLISAIPFDLKKPFIQIFHLILKVSQ